MFLSKLVLDPAHPQARRDLANPYEMHRTLSRVYAERPENPPARFLWRLENSGDFGRQEGATLIVQSATPGNWECLQAQAGYVRTVHADKRVAMAQLLQPERSYRFRLCCNPTVTRNGKRYGLFREEEQLAWLVRQGLTHGFTLQQVRIVRSERVSYRKEKGAHRITLQAVQFDGLLQAADMERLEQALLSGIGHAKALGMGMLSLAPPR